MSSEFPSPWSPENRRRLARRLRSSRLEKGWDLKELAERAHISRTTLHHLERGETRNPRSSTLKRIAVALEIAVGDLGDNISQPGAKLPLASLRLDESRFDRQTNPVVEEVLQAEPDLFRDWHHNDWEELYSTFGTGGALNTRGVMKRAEQINRKREAVRQLQIVMETHLGDVAEQLVNSLYEMIQPGSPAIKLEAFSPLLASNELEPGTEQRSDRKD